MYNSVNKVYYVFLLIGVHKPSGLI